MGTRIRYKTDNNMLVSTESFLTFKGNLKVLIDTVNNSYSLVHQETNAIINQGTGTSLSKVKKAAKSALVLEGAHFEGESRAKRLVGEFKAVYKEPVHAG